MNHEFSYSASHEVIGPESVFLESQFHISFHILIDVRLLFLNYFRPELCTYFSCSMKFDPWRPTYILIPFSIYLPTVKSDVTYGCFPLHHFKIDDFFPDYVVSLLCCLEIYEPPFNYIRPKLEVYSHIPAKLSRKCFF